jgi:hypothetical protein
MKSVYRLSMQPDQSKIDYLKTEIEIGIVFARMAIGSEDSGRTDRNRRYARVTYETVRGFTSNRRVTLRISASDLSVLEAKLTRLRTQLQQLGESFPD